MEGMAMDSPLMSPDPDWVISARGLTSFSTSDKWEQQ